MGISAARRRRRGARAVHLALLAAVAAGCAGAGATTDEATTPRADGPLTRTPSLADRTPSAAAVVQAMANAGIPVPRPVDTTALECPRAGCEQSIVTDTLRVKSFATPQKAVRYAEAQRLWSDGNIVVAFAPPLNEAAREHYWADIEAIL
jgi:hypothetical protein